MIENDIAHRRAHWNFENPGANDVAADANKFQTARTTRALCNEPIDTTRENLRNVDERLDVVDDRGLLPEADLAGEGRFIARLGAMAFDGFDKRALLATDVAAGTDKNFEIVVEVAAQDLFSEKACAV